ncbi:hypothetical protein CBM2634_B120007 [Cupriavidus taiwanensis]|uniref:Uncharacterized protein n=1 Tax=Cupriavidus taiwanensis TaxID=164546 RepID=A0A375J3Y0_9BURK|nr:hypothetical protein CBM2634_B120007 [Cupriavidus taiwanensis]
MSAVESGKASTSTAPREGSFPSERRQLLCASKRLPAAEMPRIASMGFQDLSVLSQKIATKFARCQSWVAIIGSPPNGHLLVRNGRPNGRVTVLANDTSWPLSAFGRGPAGTWSACTSLLVTNLFRSLRTLAQQGLAGTGPESPGVLTHLLSQR